MKCAVLNCENDRKVNVKDISYFSFPKDDDLLNIWIKFCRRLATFKPKCWKICSEHFDPADIIGDQQVKMGLRKTRGLRVGAVPCIYNEEILPSAKTQLMDKRKQEKIDDYNSESEEYEQENVSTPPPSLTTTTTTTTIQEVILPEILIQNNENSVDGIPVYLTLENVKMLENKVFKLELQVKHLKRHSQIREKNHAIQIEKLKEKIQGLKREKFMAENLKRKLRKIFTEGQIKRIEQEKRTEWSDNDITQALILYSTSSKAYQLLRDMNYPLPGKRTLQIWTKKNDVASDTMESLMETQMETLIEPKREPLIETLMDS